MDAHEMQTKLEQKTLADRKLYLSHALSAWPEATVTHLAEWLLLQPPGRVTRLPWQEIFAGVETAPVERIRALYALLPHDTVPGLLLLPQAKLENPAQWLETAALTAAALARDVLRCPWRLASKPVIGSAF